MVREVAPKQQCSNIVDLKTKMPETLQGQRFLLEKKKLLTELLFCIPSLVSLQLNNMRGRMKTVLASLAQVCMVQMCGVCPHLT